ncbi:MAG: flagellar biosynthetic protein FliO [Peptostreptococcaceae bacterium]|nr:flagellar biosynthetic protein FliO [Peptostreptococcaceae bacterium]
MGNMNFTQSLIKLFIAFPVVIMVAYFSLRLGNRYLKRMGNTRNLEVIETVPIYNKAVLSIVRIFDAYYVLGVTEHGVETIRELSDTEIDAFLRNGFSNGRSFVGKLKSFKWKEKVKDGYE